MDNSSNMLRPDPDSLQFYLYGDKYPCNHLPQSWLSKSQFKFHREFLRLPFSMSSIHFSTTMTPTTTTTNTDLHPQLHHHHDGLHFWQFMLAGSVAGCVEHTAMFPVDTLKTRMQALGPPNPIQARFLTLRQSLASILRLEGPSALYRGIWAMGLGAGPAHAVYFSVYEVCKKSLSDSSASHGAAGVVATVASDAVLTPMDVVKQRLQLTGSPYMGVGDCVRRMAAEEGLGAFYASYWTTIVMNAPFTAVHFATYEAAKRALVVEEHSEEGLVVHATAGAVAGALAAAVTTPLDVVKTQLQCQGVCGCDRFSSCSIGHVTKTIVKKEGYGGLMRGWMPRMLFHAPAAAICWSTYESSKSFFQKLNNTH